MSLNKNVIERKREICARSENYHHDQIYVPAQDDYITGFRSKPERFSAYHGGAEPVVSASELYDLPSDSWLTVNRYNALVLNSCNMLIADVDFGDGRLNRFAGARNCEEVVDNLRELDLLDHEHLPFEDWSFAAQSYRVYRTHSGCRVICTSISVPWACSGWAATRFMRFLRADPQYVELCGVQKCYRARLTAKPWRMRGEGAHVCELVATVGKGEVAQELVEQIRLHDELRACLRM